jgi:hypothetical protein
MLVCIFQFHHFYILLQHVLVQNRILRLQLHYNHMDLLGYILNYKMQLHYFYMQ